LATGDCLGDEGSSLRRVPGNGVQRYKRIDVFGLSEAWG
jgi:hypothetical protein